MAAAGTAIAWVDAETTTLTAHKGHLLEIACLVTDTSLNVLSDEPFTAVVKYSRDEMVALYQEADNTVREMHTATGLWGRLHEGAPLREVEEGLLQFIKRYGPERDTVHIGGNSTRLDLNFIEEHLPSVADHLHYRMVDVSALALLCQWDFGVSVRKGSDHTALTDITESLEQLRILWGPIKEAVAAQGVTFRGETPLVQGLARASAPLTGLVAA